MNSLEKEIPVAAEATKEPVTDDFWQWLRPLFDDSSLDAEFTRLCVADDLDPVLFYLLVKGMLTSITGQKGLGSGLGQPSEDCAFIMPGPTYKGKIEIKIKRSFTLSSEALGLVMTTFALKAMKGENAASAWKKSLQYCADTHSEAAAIAKALRFLTLPWTREK